MKHEVRGLLVEIKFNETELRDAVLKKIINSGELRLKELREKFAFDLLNDRFLQAELSVTLSKMCREGILERSLKSYGEGRGAQHFKIRGSTQSPSSERSTTE